MNTSLKRLTRAVGVIAATGMATAAYGVSQLNNYRLKEYTLPLLPPGTLNGRDSFDILHVSDLHMIPGQRAKAAWVSSLAELQPDLVINTGDNLSDPKGVPWVLSLIHI